MLKICWGVVCSVGVGTDRGGRQHNEDNYLACLENQTQWMEKGHAVRRPAVGHGIVLAVCDGLGGHQDGAVASRAAVKAMSRLYQPVPPSDPERTLLRYVREAHTQLYWKARGKGSVEMGTTLTLCWLMGTKMAWCQVGDSRLHVYRDGTLSCLTQDQTVNTFARRDGRTELEKGNHLAQCFIYGSRGIGDNTQLRLDQGVDSGTCEMLASDWLLLTTDGCHDFVRRERLQNIMSSSDSPQQIASQCVEAAVDGGSRDNITVLVAKIEQLGSVLTDVQEDDDDEATFIF